MIEEKIVFQTMGQSFDSLEKAQSFRVDKIGDFIEPLCNQMQLSPKQKIRLAEFFENPSNRNKLINLLDF